MGCDRAGTKETGRTHPGADDLAIGPMVYQGAVLTYLGKDLPGAPPSPDAHGLMYYKTRAQLPPDATMTVFVVGISLPFAGIMTENGPAAGYPSATYPGAVWRNGGAGRALWAGGFSLFGQFSTCLLSEVRVEGKTTPLRFPSLTASIPAASSGSAKDAAAAYPGQARICITNNRASMRPFGC